MKKLCVLVLVAALWAGVAWGEGENLPEWATNSIHYGGTFEEFVAGFIKNLQDTPYEYRKEMFDVIGCHIYIMDRLSKKSRDFKEYYSWDATEEVLLDYYRSARKTKPTAFSLYSVFLTSKSMEEKFGEYVTDFIAIRNTYSKDKVTGIMDEQLLIKRLDRAKEMSKDLLQ